MYDIETADDSAERWEQVKHHLAAIIWTIQSAAAIVSKPPY